MSILLRNQFQNTRQGYLQNSKLTKAQIDELQKALPKCKIVYDAKK